MGKRVKDSEILEAIPRYAGLKAQVARSLGVTWATVNNRIKKNKKLDEALRETREGIIDLSEQKLYEAVKNGEPWAIKCVLFGIGRERGYSENHNVTATVKNFQIEVIYGNSQTAQEGAEADDAQH